ncbi:Thioredoxin, dsba oxidoreductase family protein [Paraburkholderia piptadeniae]|uniref:Thioredoxin, dsba oxidoreductase family protein n=1 Tax=Paraburkholderia piptadeniae TaxID=1701573 RepID=A0A1N7SQH7_9BURK|nr:DsbA family oxidoreductase [Paraburkholderia piptadeniae]SIT49584.1 Thioredoxin, dsba oxidoreductase family protein [Paraburkholderia piptadeniae]
MNFSDLACDVNERDHAHDAQSLTVEVFFDFICPWCMIAKRNLEAAVRQLADIRPDVQPNVLWRSHQLLPETPMSGLPYQTFYLARLGSAEAVSARRAQVQRAGGDVGIRFAFERIELLPNTAAAHALVGWAAAHGTSAQHALLVERLFSAYFVDGANIGDWRVLETIGMQCGLECADRVRHLDDAPCETARVLRKAYYHIHGVPHFLFNGTIGLSGAHSSSVVLDAMLRSLQH